MNSMIRASSLIGFREVVQGAGMDPAQIMRRWNVPADIADRPDDLIPFRVFSAMLEAVAVESGMPDVGLRVASRQKLDILGPIAVVARNAETVAIAIEDVSHYLHLHSPVLAVQAEPLDRGKVCRVIFSISARDGLQHRQVNEMAMQVGMQILRLLAGERAVMQGLYLPHARMAAPEVYAQLFGCPVFFEQHWCGFDLTADLADHRIDSAHPLTRRIATEYLELKYDAHRDPLYQQVSAVVRNLLSTGNYSINTVAEQLVLHPRTLQRRLAEEGTSYDEILDKLRRDIANSYLAEPSITLSQLAGMLGYAEQSAFSRAFKRWYGVSPRQYRSQMAAI